MITEFEYSVFTVSLPKSKITVPGNIAPAQVGKNAR